MIVKTKGSQRAIETRYATKTRDLATHTEEQITIARNQFSTYVRFEQMLSQGQYVCFQFVIGALKITRFSHCYYIINRRATDDF